MTLDDLVLLQVQIFSQFCAISHFWQAYIPRLSRAYLGVITRLSCLPCGVRQFRPTCYLTQVNTTVVTPTQTCWELITLVYSKTMADPGISGGGISPLPFPSLSPFSFFSCISFGAISLRLLLNPARKSGKRCKLSQRVRTEHGPQLHFGAFLTDRSDRFFKVLYVRRLGLVNLYVPLGMHLLIPVCISHCPKGI